jgi:hypothetical protein
LSGSLSLTNGLTDVVWQPASQIRQAAVNAARPVLVRITTPQDEQARTGGLRFRWSGRTPLSHCLFGESPAGLGYAEAGGNSENAADCREISHIAPRWRPEPSY